MNRVEKIFVAIDKLFDPSQNKKQFPDITSELDICYWDKYKDECITDFYYDKKVTGKYPIFINIHGGGFVKGDKKFRRSISGHFASLGYFVITPNYRLSPKYQFPSGAEDMVELLDMIPTIAAKYNLDTTRIVASGDSAGAYYATMATSICLSEEYRTALKVREPQVKITALVSFCGPYNLLLAIKKKLPLGITRILGESFTGMKLDRNISNISEYGYLKYLNPTDFVKDTWVPTFIVYAEKDIFCKGHAEDWMQKLETAKIPYSEFHATKLLENHCFHLTLLTKKSEECMGEVTKFLKELK